MSFEVQSLFLALALVVGCSGPGSAGGGPGDGEGAAGAAAGVSGADAAAGQGAAGACSGDPAVDASLDDGATPDGLSVSAACGACETAYGAPDNPLCPATLLTATYSQDPDTGNQVAVGWGLETLGTAEQRAAGAALLHCLNVHRCSTDAKNQCAGDFPSLGCFCGAGVDPVACLSGVGLHGACLAEYEAAATVTPGGPPLGSSRGALALYVSERAGDPTGPIGLADMIERCAIADPCPICLQL